MHVCIDVCLGVGLAGSFPGVQKCRGMMCGAVPHCRVQCGAVQSVWCSAVQVGLMRCGAVQYSMMLFIALRYGGCSGPARHFAARCTRSGAVAVL